MDNSNSLFNLNATQLHPIVQAVAGKPIRHFTWEAQPVAANAESRDKQRCAFRYTTLEGESGEAILFVKRCVWKGRSEAVHYRYLSSRGVPVPHLYGVLPNGDAEVIFLEWVTATGFRDESESEWREMLSLLARLNACGITPDYASHLHAFEQVGILDGGLWLLGLEANPNNAEIETSLRMCGAEAQDVPRLLQAARTVLAQVAVQPRGLVHQDFLPDNLGWRGERETLVVFDLHKNALGPRFADVAPYLGLPDWSNRVAFLDADPDGTMSRRERLVRHYLSEYAQFGGSAVSLQDFHAETTALFRAHKVAALGWYVEQKRWTCLRAILDFLFTIPVSP
jgi:hypothetical protein